MAASFNKVILMGNLTRDPDLRYLPNGAGVCELGIAVNRRYTNSAGQEIDEPCFVDIVVWGKTAENCRQFLEKGSQVMIEGRLQLDQWEDKNGGGKRSKLRVVAETVQFMSRKQNAQDFGGNNGNNYSEPPRNQQYNGDNNRYQGQYNNNPTPRGFQPRQNSSMPMPENNQASFVESNSRNGNFNSRPMPPMPEDAFSVDDNSDDDIPF